jgi:hypothetical protein
VEAHDGDHAPDADQSQGDTDVQADDQQHKKGDNTENT